MQLGDQPLRVTANVSWTPRGCDVAEVEPNPSKR